jgi:hypothetical protein
VRGDPLVDLVGFALARKRDVDGKSLVGTGSRDLLDGVQDLLADGLRSGVGQRDRDDQALAPAGNR